MLVQNAGVVGTHNSAFKHTTGSSECKYNHDTMSLHWNRDAVDEVACVYMSHREMLKRNTKDKFTQLHFIPAKS